MFGLFKRKQKEEVVEPVVVETEDHLKKISEPVWSIVRALEERPDTFRFSVQHNVGSNTLCYTVKDSVTGIIGVYRRRLGRIGVTKSVKLLYNGKDIGITIDEMLVLKEAGEKALGVKEERIAAMKDARNTRLRNEITKLYN